MSDKLYPQTGFCLFLLNYCELSEHQSSVFRDQQFACMYPWHSPLRQSTSYSWYMESHAYWWPDDSFPFTNKVDMRSNLSSIVIYIKGLCGIWWLSYICIIARSFLTVLYFHIHIIFYINFFYQSLKIVILTVIPNCTSISQIVVMQHQNSTCTLNSIWTLRWLGFFMQSLCVAVNYISNTDTSKAIDDLGPGRLQPLRYWPRPMGIFLLQH